MQLLFDSKIQRLTFLVLFLAFVQLLPAQKTPEKQSPTPTVTVRTSLVLVPAIITDKQGVSLEDLAKEDFIVKEDGKPQSIAIFEHIKPTDKPGAKNEPPGVYSNRFKTEQPARLVIIGIDAISTGMLERLEMRKQILDFVAKNVYTDQPVAVFVLQQNGVRIVHDFTTDPSVLVAALKNVVWGKPADQGIMEDQQAASNIADPTQRGLQDMFNRMIATESDTIQNTFQAFTRMERRRMVADTLNTFSTIAQAFSGVPGRKSLIWITNGVSLYTNEAESAALMTPGMNTREGTAPRLGVGMNSQSLETSSASAPSVSSGGISIVDMKAGTLQPLFERAWRALNTANIAVYPLDVSELSDPAFTNPALQHRGSLARPVASTFRMEQIAQETGGTPCWRTSELNDCFKKASRDSDDYYVLGFYANPENTKKNWRKLEVSVARKDVKIRARSGYFPRPAEASEDKPAAVQLATAISSPLDYSGFPMEVKLTNLTAADGAPGKKRVNFSIFVPPSANCIAGDDYRIDLDFAALAKSPDARPVGEFSKHAAGALKPQAAADIGIHGIVMPGSIDLGPGDYQIKFVVRDNQSARLGSVTVPVKVEK